MTRKNTKPTKPPNQTSSQTTMRVNVSDLTPSQRQKLFKDCMSQTGFMGFIKHQDEQNKQTHYTFTYGN